MISEAQREQLLKSVRECQQRSKKTLANIDTTLQNVKETLKDIEETNSNIDSIKKEFGNMMDKLAKHVADSFSGAVTDPFKYLYIIKGIHLIRIKEGYKYQYLATDKASEKDISILLQQQDTVLILTGAGVSVASGIPTFRGKSGLYDKKFISKTGSKVQAERFITRMTYDQEPQSIWKWVDEIYRLSCSAKSNQIHQNVHDLALCLSRLGKKVVVATQNIDDLHLKPQNAEYQYFNIHGNCKQVRCKNHHFTSYQKISRQHQYKNQNLKTSKAANALCSQCQSPLRPHLLFFDESYGKNYGGQIKDREFPFVIVIGSSVSTGLAIKFLQKASITVEINPEPVIEVGRVFTFREDAGKVLKNIEKALLQQKK